MRMRRCWPSSQSAWRSGSVIGQMLSLDRAKARNEGQTGALGGPAYSRGGGASGGGDAGRSPGRAADGNGSGSEGPGGGAPSGSAEAPLAACRRLNEADQRRVVGRLAGRVGSGADGSRTALLAGSIRHAL